MIDIKIKKLYDDVLYLPKRANPGDAGYDICAYIPPDLSEVFGQRAVWAQPNKRVLVKTGIAISMPSGIQCEVRSRSGLALKNGLFVLNSPGTIDSGYTGEIGIIIANFSDEDFLVTHGMKIAQLVFMPVVSTDFKEVQDLEETARGAGGFGSTGV